MNQTANELLNQGKQKQQEGKLQEAIADFLSALKVDPNNYLTHEQLGNTFFQQKKLDKAIFHFHQALEMNCNVSLVHYNLAEIYKQENKIEKAVEHYTRAIQIEPFYNPPFIQLMFMRVII